MAGLAGDSVFAAMGKGDWHVVKTAAPGLDPLEGEGAASPKAGLEPLVGEAAASPHAAMSALAVSGL